MTSKSNKKISVVVCAYNMRRELPRTILSLSPHMQKGISADDYEVIIVDNGSSRPAIINETDYGNLDIKILNVAAADATCSPVSALNAGMKLATGEIVCAMIDGARIASPGLLACALKADRLADRIVTVSLAFHLGEKVQMESVLEGYDQSVEDKLLDEISWREDGYRLFDVSVLAGSSQGGWYNQISESNAIFMRRNIWDELGGFDERFITPGGGLVNLDTLARAVVLPGIDIVTILGEGTFHQVHGGVATNAIVSKHDIFSEEYLRLKGFNFTPPKYKSFYFGTGRETEVPLGDRLTHR